MRISKCKNIFVEGYTSNWSEEVLVISKIKNTVPWTYAISGSNGQKINVTFYEQKIAGKNQEEFGIEKVIKRKEN